MLLKRIDWIFGHDSIENRSGRCYMERNNECQGSVSLKAVSKERTVATPVLVNDKRKASTDVGEKPRSNNTRGWEVEKLLTMETEKNTA